MQNQHTQKIGFIGLGLMGKPMCRNLIQAGFELFVAVALSVGGSAAHVDVG